MAQKAFLAQWACFGHARPLSLSDTSLDQKRLRLRQYGPHPRLVLVPVCFGYERVEGTETAGQKVGGPFWQGKLAPIVGIST